MESEWEAIYREVDGRNGVCSLGASPIPKNLRDGYVNPDIPTVTFKSGQSGKELSGRILLPDSAYGLHGANTSGSCLVLQDDFETSAEGNGGEPKLHKGGKGGMGGTAEEVAMQWEITSRLSRWPWGAFRGMRGINLIKVVHPWQELLEEIYDREANRPTKKEREAQRKQE